MTTSEMCDKALNKANEVLKPLGKTMTLHDNGNGTYAININGMLLYDSVPSDRLFMNISVALMGSLINS